MIGGNVQNWTGTITISGGGSATDPVSGVQYITSQSGTVTLTGAASHGGPCNASQSEYAWGTTPTQVSLSNVSIHDKLISPSVDANGNPCTSTLSFDVDGGWLGHHPLRGGHFVEPHDQSDVRTQCYYLYGWRSSVRVGLRPQRSTVVAASLLVGPGGIPPSALPVLPATPTISPDGTQAEYTIPFQLANTGFAAVALSSYDWGGWATLNVTVTISGQAKPTVQGYIQQCDNSTSTDILLPAREPESLIAYGWKKAYGLLGRPDNDDSETIKANNPNLGDGPTLYEEYRGFYVDCDQGPSSACVPLFASPPTRAFRHFEGDPTKLDLFVVNDSYPEVVSGIQKFQDGTGIQVCCTAAVFASHIGLECFFRGQAPEFGES